MAEFRDLSASKAVRNSGSAPVAGTIPIFTGVNNDVVQSEGAPVLQGDNIFTRVSSLEGEVAAKADQTDLDTVVTNQTNLVSRVKTVFGTPAANRVLISNGSADLSSDTLDALVTSEVGSSRVVSVDELGQLVGLEQVTPATATPWDVVTGAVAGLNDVGAAIDRWSNFVTAAVAEDIVSNVYTFDWPTAVAKNRTSVRTINIAANTSIVVPALLGPTYNPEIATAGRINFLKLIITNTSGGSVTVQPASTATGRMPLALQSGLSNPTLAAGETISLFIYIRGNSGLITVVR